MVFGKKNKSGGRPLRLEPKNEGLFGNNSKNRFRRDPSGYSLGERKLWIFPHLCLGEFIIRSNIFQNGGGYSKYPLQN